MVTKDAGERATIPKLGRGTWLLLLVLALAWAIVSWRNAWVCDDAYITFRSVEQLHAGNGPRWNAHARVQAYTHPLWYGVLATARVVSSAPWWNAVVLSFLLSTTALALVARRLLRWPGQPGQRALALALLALLALASKAFVDYSSGGLENALVFALLAVFLSRLTAFTKLTEPSPRDLTRLIAVGSLLLLCRHDLLLIVAPPLAVLAWRARGAGLVALARAFFLGTAPFVAWTAFSLLYYGFPFPNTAYAKLNTGIGDAQLWRQGLAYVENAARWDPVTALVCAAGVVALLMARRPAWLALGVGCLGHLLYIAKVGGDFMAGRFLTPVFFIGLATLSASSLRWPRRAVSLALAGLGLVLLMLPGSRLGVDVDRGFVSYLAIDQSESGIADEKRVWTGRGSFRGVERSLQARAWTFKGEKAQQDGVPIVHTAVGWDGFNAGLDTVIIDAYALADPLLARLPARRPWRIGHFARSVPAGYPETLASGRNQILNPSIHGLYEHVRAVTEGPIFSLGRLKSILYLNLVYRRPECAAPPCRNLRTYLLDPSVRAPFFAAGTGVLDVVELRSDPEDSSEDAASEDAASEKESRAPAETLLTLGGWMPDADADVLLITGVPIERPSLVNVWRQEIAEEGRFGPLAGFAVTARFDDPEQARRAAASACVVARLHSGDGAGEWRLIPRQDGRCRELLRD